MIQKRVLTRGSKNRFSPMIQKKVLTRDSKIRFLFVIQKEVLIRDSKKVLARDSKNSFSPMIQKKVLTRDFFYLRRLKYIERVESNSFNSLTFNVFVIKKPAN